MRDGRLAPCKRTPNCVSSQADPNDAEHYISPIACRGPCADAIRAAREAIESMPGSTVIRQAENYLYAEFRTRLMRYVDDLELVHDERAGVLHVRSASRLGRRDFGVNRKRVETLRRRIASKARPSP